jgi:hypothetical protein
MEKEAAVLTASYPLIRLGELTVKGPCRKFRLEED